MKLMCCTKCGDVVSLRSDERSCFCGESKGKYKEDGLNAIISGPCIPLGFANSSFINALKNQPERGMGKEFTAFVIQKQCNTIEIV